MAKAFGAILNRQLRTSAGKSDSRRKLIGAVRAAASRMQLSDEDRREIQLDLTGKASMSDMSLSEIGQVLDRLNRDRPAPMAHRAHIGKIRALWWTCYWLGAIEEPNDAALDKFVHRQTGASSLRFVDHRNAPPIIEALKAMAARAGVRWPTEAAVREAATVVGATAAIADRREVLLALWGKLLDAGIVMNSRPFEYFAKALKLAPDEWKWSGRDYDEAIKQLGKRWRRHLAKAVPE